MSCSLFTIVLAALVTVGIAAPGLPKIQSSTSLHPTPGPTNTNPSGSKLQPAAAHRATNSQVPLIPKPKEPDPTNPFDLSGILSLASIGDSYSAGIGAGTLLDASDKDKCKRANSSYPYQLNQLLGEDSRRVFQFIACSGAVSSDILKEQVPRLGQDYQAITISAGGNDVGLVDVLEACIYAWRPGLDCKGTLATTSEKIKNELPGNIERLIKAVKPKLSKDGTIYYTGYAKFFDTKTTECDSVSWAYWTSGLDKPYLTKDLRQQMNDLVESTNLVLEKTVAAAGDQVVFVNYDRYFGDLGGLFCEPGVKEPAPERPFGLFFQWDSKDTPRKSGVFKSVNGTESASPAQSGSVKTPQSEHVKNNRSPPTTRKEDTTPRPNPKMEQPTRRDVLYDAQVYGKHPRALPYPITKSSQAPASLQPGGVDSKTPSATTVPAEPLQETAQSHQNQKDNPTKITSPGQRIDDIEQKGILIPESAKKTFHPNILGHSVIAGLVYFKMAGQRAKALNIDMPPEVGDPVTSCPAPPPKPPPRPKTKCEIFNNGACTLSGCNGVLTGKCTEGDFKDCGCTSTTSTACSLCGGTPSYGGKPGYCMTGPFKGQRCTGN